MEINKKELTAEGIRLSIEDKGREVARARLYIMQNDLHKEPFGFVEDVFVEENFRGKGYGTKIVEALIAEAKQRGCYKLIATSRTSREGVHEFYKRLGFKEHGKEFRMNIKT
jgi:GNAT superfamily N-acetyltransferase